MMTTTSVERGRFSWRGRDVAYSVRGSGPAVVMCHGTPWASWLWEPFADAVAGDHTVYLWDMPGYGASSMEPGHDVDLGVQSEIFAALLAHWRLDAPHVIAHDYGGAVSLRAHLLHGAGYASLCLVDVVALRPWGSDFFRLVRENVEVFRAIPQPMFRALVEAYIAGASAAGLADAARDALVEPWRGERGRDAFLLQIAQADERYTAEIEDVLADVRCPVHIVWGEDDTWIPVDRAERLQRAIPSSTVSVIPGAGHLIQLDRPAALSAELVRWLSAQR